MEIFTKNSAKCTIFQRNDCNNFSSLMYNEASNYPFLCSYNIMNDAGLNMLGFTDYDFIDEYMEKQKEALLFLITKTCGHVYKSYLSHHDLMTTCLTKRKIMW
jgi:hypothetical protein